MGERGPVPSRSETRIRTNAPPIPIATAPLEGVYPAPFEADDDWHPTALKFWDSCQRSGQARFYAETDWWSIYFLCEVLTRELNPQFIGMAELPTTYALDPNTGERYVTSTGGQKPIAGKVAIKGASLGAIRAQMAVLLINEGDRRRLQVELNAATDEASSDVSLAAVRDIQSAFSQVAQQQAT